MRIEIKTGLLIFTLFCSVYLLCVRGNIEISDTYFSVQTAKSIVANGSLSPEGCRLGYCYKSKKDGLLYSRFGLGLPFIFTPYVLAANSLSPFTNFPQDKLINFLISFYNIFFGALACVVMFFLTRLFRNSNRASLVMALLLGFGTFCWRYSAWDFSEAAQMFFLLLAIYGVLKNSLKSLTAGGISFSCLLLLKVLYLIYLPLFILYILVKNRQSLKIALGYSSSFLFTAMLGFGLILFLNSLRFGDIFQFGYGLEVYNFYLSGIKEHAPKLLYWLDKGIFIYNPLFILGIAGYFVLFRSFPKETLFFISLIALNFILTAMWYGWHGGSCWGPRYLVPFAPLWLLPCFVFFKQKGLIRIILASLIFISVSIQGVSILQGDLEYLSICNANDQEGLRKGMPAQIVGSVIMLKHKITEKNNTYKLQEFGIDSESEVNTSMFSYNNGFDLWYLNLAKYSQKPALNYFPLLLLPLIAFCLIRLFKITKNN